MAETWKDIKGYEGRYQISNQGRVKSLRCKETLRERVLKDHDNGGGYRYISLRNERGRKNFYVHRLVAEVFVENPKNYDYVNHLDYDKSNEEAIALRDEVLQETRG